MEYLLFWAVMYVLIFVHELGHFIFATVINVEIETFQVGLITITSFQFKGVQINLGLIPIMGYIKPRTGEENLTLTKDMIASLGGPVASIVAGFILLIMAGKSWLGALKISLLVVCYTPIYVLSNLSGFIITNDTTSINGFVHSAQMLDTSANEALLVIAIISLALFAGVQILPIPPLDGGRFVFALLEVLFGHKKLPIFIDDKAVSIITAIRVLLTLIVVCYFIYTWIAEIWFLIF